MAINDRGFADALEAMMSTPGLTTDNPAMIAKVMNEIQQQRNEAKVNETDATKNAAQYEQLAAELNAVLPIDESFELLGPESLTVFRGSEKGFGKSPHIGTEKFTIDKFYCGKKEAILVVMKPVDAVGYLHAEMPIKDAFEKLDHNFFSLFNGCVEGGVADRIKSIKKSAQADKQQAAAVAQIEQYADIGFGTF